MQPIFKNLGAIALALCLSAATASAATIITRLDGRLDRAENVDVDGTLYNVDIRTGSCRDVFNPCSTSFGNLPPFGTALAFSTEAQAQAASEALSLQVLSTNPAGIKFPTAIFSILTPYGLEKRTVNGRIRDYVQVVRVMYREPFFYDDGSCAYDCDNLIVTTTRDVLTGSVFADSADGIFTQTSPAYAVWSISPDNIGTVPLPAGGLLLLSGLAGVIAMKRRKDRAA